ncbi:hypothetical protein L6452_26778 [Arctium lappa]|uniref:Uncharacterized protein n=1 Tax=Arctium lappa TaxID=4217 RepID=A0ACB8ZW60_ARCLA|nr:hypothetical protein L6452_26778 [Arctium lappa]
MKPSNSSNSIGVRLFNGAIKRIDFTRSQRINQLRQSTPCEAFLDTNVEEIAISSDIPILQEINSSELQLWVELPILDNVWYDRDDVNPTEVHNVNELLRTSSTQFVVVDDDEDEENEAEYEDEQEDILVDSDSD